MNPKSQGKGNKKTNKGKKRKKDANVSSDDGNHNKVNVLSTSQGDGNSNDSIFTEVARDLKVCFSTPISSITTMNPMHAMNYNVSPVGYQPQNPSVAQPVGFIAHTDSQYESKIDNLAQKLDLMFQKLNKLDNIESKINSFENKMTAVTKDVNELKKTVHELEKSVKFTSEKLDESEKNNSEIKTKLQSIQTLETTNANLSAQLQKLSCEMNDLNERHVDLQSRSMRDNLIFHGIVETDNENCEDKLKEFIAEKLDIRHTVEFHRVHRMGRRVHGKTRPIIAKFVQFKERELVRKSAFTKLKGEQNRNYGINEQFPREINEKRKLLYPYYKSAKRQQKRAQLIYDKLYIDGELFTPPPQDDTNNPQLDPPTRSGPTESRRLSAAAPTFTPRPRGGGRGGRGQRR